MTTIRVTDSDDEDVWIRAFGYSDLSRAVEAHGYDPNSVSWEVDDPDAMLENAIRDASNFTELKSALLGEAGDGKVRGRRP